MNADGLSRVAMSSGLAASLSRATEYARAQGHGEVTLEHILLALCDDPDAVLVLAASNVNLSELTTEIGRHLSALPTRPQGPERDLMVAGDLKRILEAAAAAARGGRRREINGAIVLAAIIGDGKSAAAHVLSSQGLTFEAAIRALQSKPAAAPEPPTAPSARPLPQPDAESILASARERVQSRTGGRPAHREDAHEEPEFETPDFEPQEAGKDHHETEEELGQDFERREPHFDSEPVPRTAPPPPAPPMAHRPPSPQPPAAAPLRPSMPPAVHEPTFSAPPPPVARPVEPQQHPGYEAPRREPARAPYVENDYASQPYEQQGPYGQADYSGQADYGEDESFAAPDYDEGGYAPSPAMPASPPFPPPVPMPSPHEGWAPPPTPDTAAERPAYPIRPPMQREVYVPAPMSAPGPAGGQGSGGPPPLAPWPEAEPAFDGVMPGSAGGMAVGRRSAAPMPRAGARHPAPRAEIGQLVENIPRSMRVAVPAMIEVRIARADVKALAEGLQGGGAAYQHDVAITKAMSVRLRAPDGGFFIETASPETQWIERSALLSEDDFASWRWHVTPRDAGRKRLQLIISARTMSADGMVAETALPDQVITVRVRTNYGQVASRWIGWGVAAVAGGLLAKFGEGAFAMLGKVISG